MVEVSLIVGKLDASLALLLTKEHHLIEFPTILLPKDVQAGSIVKISCERDEAAEQADKESFLETQEQIMQTFGTFSPKAPNLRVRNVTETSAVLEWDPIEVATAEVISLTLFKNGARFGIIPSPLTRTAIKLSGLAIDTAYTFELVLATTAGTYHSEELHIKTHKMTDLTGITLCVGTIEDTDIDRADLEETIKNIGAKPLQDKVQLDTTHFVCTVGEGDQWKRALAMNIPVVRPEWIKACEAERRLVSVRAYYLNADPKLRPPVQRSRAASQVTQASGEIGHRRAVSEITDGPIKPNHPVNNIPQSVPEESEDTEEKTKQHEVAQEEAHEPVEEKPATPASETPAVESQSAAATEAAPEAAPEVVENNVSVAEASTKTPEPKTGADSTAQDDVNDEVNEATSVKHEIETDPATETAPVAGEKSEETLKLEEPSPASEESTIAEPVSESVSEPVSEPVAESVAESVAEPVAEPASEPVAEPVAEPAAEPVAEPAAEPVTETEAETEVKTEETTPVEKTEEDGDITSNGDIGSGLAEAKAEATAPIEKTEEDGDITSNGDIGGDLAKDAPEPVPVTTPTHQTEPVDENGDEENGDIADLGETPVDTEESAPLSKSAKKNQKKKAKKAAAAAAAAAVEADKKDDGDLEDVAL